MLMLALEYLPEYKLEADADMIKRIEAALQVKIGLLNRDFQSMQNGDDIKSMIWQRFGGGSKASRARELAQYGDHLTIETEELLAKVTKIKTVQAIQKELNQRSRRGVLTTFLILLCLMTKLLMNFGNTNSAMMMLRNG